MEFKINRTKSKTGKRILFFATIQGKRVGKTNFAKKWECEHNVKSFIEFHGDDKINEMIKSN